MKFLGVVPFFQYLCRTSEHELKLILSLIYLFLLFTEYSFHRDSAHRVDDQPPQPVDPENESMSHVEFWAAFHALA